MLPIPTDRPRRRARTAVAALTILLSTGLTVGAGTLPASAETTRTPAATSSTSSERGLEAQAMVRRNVEIQTYWDRQHQVRSVEVLRMDGSRAGCYDMHDDDGFPSGLPEIPSWQRRTISLWAPATYRLRSYDAPGCATWHATAGGAGDITTGGGHRWTVYATRAPKLTR